MLRKEVPAIYEADFEEFLRSVNLYDNLVNGEIRCCFCQHTVTLQNIFSFFFRDGYQFCCNNATCMRAFSAETHNDTAC